MFLSDDLLGIPFFEFETGFPQWEHQLEPPTISSLPLPPSVHSNSSLDDETNDTSPANKEDERERKRKRMISNRESARRSRMRKHEHLEGLRNQLTRLKIDNEEMKKRLGIIARNFHFFRMDNDRLLLESEILSRILSDIRQILIFRKLQELSPSMSKHISLI